MYNYTRHIPLAFISPCWLPFASLLLPFQPPFYLLGTPLAVTGSVHLGLRLLVNWPPLFHPLPNPPPSKFPGTPTIQHLTKTTSGRIWHLLSGTSSTPVITVYIYTYCTVGNLERERERALHRWIYGIYLLSIGSWERQILTLRWMEYIYSYIHTYSVR